MTETITVYDELSETTFEYQDFDEMLDSFREMFSDEVHPVIDQLADALINGEYTGDYEAYLGIRID